MSSNKTTDVATTSNASFEQWREMMFLQADTLDSESDFDPRTLFAAANEAATFEDVVQILNGGNTKNGKDLVGIVHTVHSFKIRRSDDKYSSQGIGLGVFVTVTATIDGEELTYTTGATNIVALLWHAEQFERLPLKCVITSKETVNGELLSLKPVS